MGEEERERGGGEERERRRRGNQTERRGGEKDLMRSLEYFAICFYLDNWPLKRSSQRTTGAWGRRRRKKTRIMRSRKTTLFLISRRSARTLPTAEFISTFLT